MKELIDRFGRVHRSLRISVTDRCNIRCQYCMPAGPVAFLPRADLLRYEEIARFVEIISGFGVTRLRLTGGEPLVRSNLAKLIALLKSNTAIESIALTTNAMLLEEQVEALAASGLDQINVSLDTLREETFQKLSRRKGLQRVLAGIDAALHCGYAPRLNAVLMSGINDTDAVGLVEYAIARGLTMRFIEYMPLDSDQQWNMTQMMSGERLRMLLSERFGPLHPIPRNDPARPAQDYAIEGGGQVGFIDSVTQAFCQACDRLRLTAEGKLRNCLFGREEWDIRQALRHGDTASLIERIDECVTRKYAGHGIGEPGFAPPERAMYQIGG